MLQEVRAGVKWRRTALLRGAPIPSERPRPNPQGGEARSGESR
jgi:hypothetical protein